MQNREYKLEIDPRILELLGPSLYTNIYYILAELIANAYDADANNVWIFDNEDDITVEDDGKGMSYENGDIKKYLNVAGITRTGENDAYTPSGRKKMGRKGVGKLAALSVSENVIVKTRVEEEKSGFILSRHPGEKKMLEPLPEEKINFKKVRQHGTAVVMSTPQYKLHVGLNAVKKNLLRIFPLVSKDFKIHLVRGKDEETIARSDKDMVEELCALITFGEPFSKYKNYFKTEYLDKKDVLLKTLQTKIFPDVFIMNKNYGKPLPYNIEIRGWIGAYKSTRNRKQEATDFPDNFISLYANEKMGEFNILPVVGQNKLNEVYVVGQLHIDIFELSELVDMALSNRQGYKTDDIRYQTVIKYVREELLPEIVGMRVEYAARKKENQKRKKLDKQKEVEELFKKQVDGFKNTTSADAAKKIVKELGAGDSQKVEKILQDTINNNSAALGLKPRIDQDKKKILISHTKKDKDLADVIYEMLLFNGVPKIDIIYTNCEDEEARIPVGQNGENGIYDYLKKFFMDSYSNQKIFVIFVTSIDMRNSWGAIVEVGAAWIARSEHKIFNIGEFRPEQPLDTASIWQNSKRKSFASLCTDSINYDTFCQFIEYICTYLGYSKKSRDENKKKLKKLGVSIE
ncbi:MAG: ATP-binding protein [Cloacibacillus sp.]